MEKDGAVFDDAPDLAQVLALLKERAHTLVELADAAMLFYRQPAPDAALVAQHVTDAIKPALTDYAKQCESVEWRKEALTVMLKQVLAQHGLKMPQLAMPLRLIVAGQLQTPAIDQVLALFGRDIVLARLKQYLDQLS
jgi:glutamyl-tRNA synthetase